MSVSERNPGSCPEDRRRTLDMVEIKNLVKRYGDLVALDHLNLQVQEGEISIISAGSM